MPAREPVHRLAKSHDAERHERRCHLGARRIARVGPHPIRQDVGDHVSREGVADLVHSAVPRILREPAFFDELKLRTASPIPVPESDRNQGGADGGQLPAHGVQVVAQLAPRIEGRRKGGKSSSRVTARSTARRGAPLIWPHETVFVACPVQAACAWACVGTAPQPIRPLDQQSRQQPAFVDSLQV